MTSFETAVLTAKILDSKKGSKISVIKVDEISSLSDYVVIATGNSSTQVKALAEEVEEKLDEAGISASHIEGHRSNSWVLLDYVDVVVHVFSNEAREYYDLDKLWQDGEKVDITDLLD